MLKGLLIILLSITLLSGCQQQEDTKAEESTKVEFKAEHACEACKKDENPTKETDIGWLCQTCLDKINNQELVFIKEDDKVKIIAVEEAKKCKDCNEYFKEVDSNNRCKNCAKKVEEAAEKELSSLYTCESCYEVNSIKRSNNLNVCGECYNQLKKGSLHICSTCGYVADSVDEQGNCESCADNRYKIDFPLLEEQGHCNRCGKDGPIYWSFPSDYDFISPTGNSYCYDCCVETYHE